MCFSAVGEENASCVCVCCVCKNTGVYESWRVVQRMESLLKEFVTELTVYQLRQKTAGVAAVCFLTVPAMTQS